MEKGLWKCEKCGSRLTGFIGDKFIELIGPNHQHVIANLDHVDIKATCLNSSCKFENIIVDLGPNVLRFIKANPVVKIAIPEFADLRDISDLMGADIEYQVVVD